MTDAVSGEVRIVLADGKYTYCRKPNGGQRALRYGEEWRDLTGDGFVLAMAQEIEAAQDREDRARLTAQECGAVIETAAALARIAEALPQATQGEWSTGFPRYDVLDYNGGNGPWRAIANTWPRTCIDATGDHTIHPDAAAANAAYIAACNPAAMSLVLAHVEALTAELVALRASRDRDCLWQNALVDAMPELADKPQATEWVPYLAGLKRDRDEAMRMVNSAGERLYVLTNEHERDLAAAQARIAALEEGLKDTLAHLVAAASLASKDNKKHAASDKIFDMMIADYQKSAERARALLAKETPDGRDA